MTTIFIDMDRVLVDIESGFQSHFGQTGNDLSSKEWWKLVRGADKFFASLPASQEIGKIRSMSDFMFHEFDIPSLILTACPSKDFLYVVGQKRCWLNRHNIWIPMIPVQGAENKVGYLLSAGDILIDDRKDTLESWEAGGGKGFYYDCKNNNFDEVRDQIMKHVKRIGC